MITSNQETTSLQESIKSSSATNHQQLEKIIIERLKSIESPKDYAALLGYFYHYFHQLEALIAIHLPVSVLPDYHQRRKSELLLNDIHALGFDATPVITTTLPDINDPITAMAALYVMEGSTLGGSMIVKILHHKGIHTGISFFNGYGGGTGTMWATFLQALNGLSNNLNDEALAIHTVQHTFEYFAAFISNAKQPLVLEQQTV